MDIQEITARIAIAEVKARYCLTLDTKDWAGYADCFTEDLYAVRDQLHCDDCIRVSCHPTARIGWQIVRPAGDRCGTRWH